MFRFRDRLLFIIRGSGGGEERGKRSGGGEEQGGRSGGGAGGNGRGGGRSGGSGGNGGFWLCHDEIYLINGQSIFYNFP